MNQIEKQVDSIIIRLKTNENLKNLRFIREYGQHTAESPISGFLAVVSVTDTSLSKSYIGDYLSSSVKGEQYLAKVEIRVYAPADESGNGLSEIISEILLGLKKADTEKIISETNASSIEFDSAMNSIYRTVGFIIEFCLCEEA